MNLITPVPVCLRTLRLIVPITLHFLGGTLRREMRPLCRVRKQKRELIRQPPKKNPSLKVSGDASVGKVIGRGWNRVGKFLWASILSPSTLREVSTLGIIQEHYPRSSIVWHVLPNLNRPTDNYKIFVEYEVSLSRDWSFQGWIKCVKFYTIWIISVLLADKPLQI